MNVDETLKKLQSLLYGMNYAVFLHRYRLDIVPGFTVEHYITKALPNCEIGGMQPVSEQEMLDEVEQSLRYAGDTGSGPKPAALNPPKFEKLLAALMEHLQQVSSNATEITTFWLKGGHPAYPVFWDFAFVIAGTNEVEVLIGSSSD